jgi:hypothetical protein
MVERREVSVRRKASGSYLWTNVGLLEDLYRRDTIQTNADSNALIRFNDNTLLEVGENSLVVIDDVKDIQLGVMRGSLVLRTVAGADRKIVVDAEGKARVEEIKLKLSKPEPLAHLVSTTPSREVEFAWKNLAKEPHFRLEISSERSFSPARTRTIESDEPSAKLAFAPGRYFWRVSGGNVSSEARQFRIAQVAPLSPAYPGSRDRIARWGGDETLQFRWLVPAEIEAGAKHVLELADDLAIQQNRREVAINAQAGAALLDGVKPGRHFWRIRSQYGDTSVESRVEGINVAEAGELALSQTFPEEGARIELTRTALRFAWDSEVPQLAGARVPAIDFELELQEADGKNVASGKSHERVYTWLQPKAGRYKWRVSALAGDKRVGQTQWRALSVQDGKPAVLLEPADKKELRYWSEPSEFLFKWSADSLGARERLDYQLELSKDAAFRETVQLARTKETVLGSEKAKVEPGTWFWRVTLLDASGVAIRSSEPRSLTTGPYPILAAPSVEASKSPKVYNPLEDEKSPVVTWEPVAEAQGYEVTLLLPGRAPASGGPTILKKTVNGTKFEIPGKGLKPGDYQWQVRAIDRARRLGEPSTAAKLQITYGAPLGAPEVTTEEVQ